jgi:GTP cyclohydrolase III
MEKEKDTKSYKTNWPYQASMIISVAEVYENAGKPFLDPDELKRLEEVLEEHRQEIAQAEIEESEASTSLLHLNVNESTTSENEKGMKRKKRDH